MGADLIGYMFKGPVTIEPAALEAAKKVAQKRVNAINKFAQLYEAYCEATQDETQTPTASISAALDTVAAMEEVTKDLPQKLVPVEFSAHNELYWDRMMSEVEHLADIDVDELFTNIVDVWNDASARDVATRTFYEDDGTRYQVLFAGERTWGDAPDGLGYTTLNTVAELELLSALGLE